jgi:hypothetical protein
MTTFQEQLDRLIRSKGEQGPLVQMLRNQIKAQESVKNLQEIDLRGHIKNQPTHSEQDYVLELLKQFNLPLTRENYLGLAYPEGVPENLDEASLPMEFGKGNNAVKQRRLRL